MAPNAQQQIMALSDDQRFALMKLRRSVADCLTRPYQDDRYLLRWLAARNYDPAAAEKMLRASLKWRQSLGVDDISNWPIPEVYKNYFPSGQLGFDKDGAPIYYIPFAGIDMWGLLHSGTKTEIIKTAVSMLENNLALARAQAEKHGPKAGQMVGILDMTGFNLKQFAWRPAAEVAIQLIQIYEANYPEILKNCYIINVPKVFALTFSVVKNFLNDYTISKIHIYKCEPQKWKQVLLEHIDPDQLPELYGGTLKDPDGNPACPSIIKPGGKVPKSYYSKNQIVENERKDEYKFATVKKGDKLCLDFDIDTAGSFLRWGFLTDGHDIKFGIVKKEKSGKESEEILPVHRVTCDQTEEEGFLPCETTGTYTVIFDNSYSYLRSKKLHYLIEVTPPLTKAEENAIANEA
ncbi:SEC14 [Nesidiocoris tenuis]|uniref:SEC14 n=1 Tax=Nesidiocoris tenuis TaxID=355587 RepID=A0ABN7AU11_9HEMI|nr:SEC14 [Nesidiocoris tenuis]